MKLRPISGVLIRNEKLVGLCGLQLSESRHIGPVYVRRPREVPALKSNLHHFKGNRPVLAALPSQFAVPIMCEVESLLSDAPLRIRVDGLESRRSYAET
jgi:hypothetical protein